MPGYLIPAPIPLTLRLAGAPPAWDGLLRQGELLTKPYSRRSVTAADLSGDLAGVAMAGDRQRNLLEFRKLMSTLHDLRHRGIIVEIGDGRGVRSPRETELGI
jgi:hypothetical protein